MKIKNSKLKIGSRGFMMLEALVVAAIITVSMLAVMAVAQKSIQVSRRALHGSQAAYLLEEGAEAVRVSRDNSWNNISFLSPGTNYYPLFSGGTWTLSSTPGTVGLFTRAVTVGSVSRDNFTGEIAESGTDDPGTKLVTVTVTWPEGELIASKSLPFYIMDIFDE